MKKLQKLEILFDKLFNFQPLGETRELLKGQLVDLTKERRKFEIDMELSEWNVTKENSTKSIKIYSEHSIINKSFRLSKYSSSKSPIDLKQEM